MPLIPLGRICFPDFCPARSLVTALLHDLLWSGCNQLTICLSFQTVSPRGQGLYSPHLFAPPWLRRGQLLGQLSAVPRHVPSGHTHSGSLLLSKERPLFLKTSSSLSLHDLLPDSQATCDPNCYSLFCC